MNRIVVRNVSKTYVTDSKQNVVLDTGASLTIPLEGVVTIIGESGAGKSTLLNIISLLDFADVTYVHDEKLQPTVEYYIDQDTYIIDYCKKWRSYSFRIKHTDESGKQRDMDVEAFRQQVVNFIFQEQRLHPNLNVKLNLKSPYFAANQSLTDEALNDAGDFIGISSTLDKLPNQLSGGERQRASILRSLLRATPIIFADEMTNNLDYHNALKVIEEVINNLADESHPLKCFLWVCHDLHMVAEHANYIVVIKREGAFCQKVDGNEVLKIDTLKQLVYQEAKDTTEQNYHIFPTVKKATKSELQQFRWVYAWNDVFKRGLWLNLDALVIITMLTLLLVFLLSMFKLGYGSAKYLEAQLIDPRISKLEIKGYEPLYLETHFVRLQKKLAHLDCGIVKENKCIITPVFDTTALVSYKDEPEASISTLVRTFRPESPLIEILFGDRLESGDKELLQSFIYNKTDPAGLIITRDELESFNYSEDDGILLSMYSFNQQQDAGSRRKLKGVVLETPLPGDVTILVREQFFLKSYYTDKGRKTPRVTRFEVYPASINDIAEIKRLVEELDMEFVDQFNLKGKMDLINQLKAKTELFAYLAILAIGFLAVTAVAVSAFYSIGSKRKELGVDISNGMRWPLFVHFYLIKSFILFVCSSALSLSIYLVGLSHWLNGRIMATPVIDSFIGLQVNSNIVVDSNAISMPVSYGVAIYTAIFMMLALSYLSCATYYSLRTPKSLLGED